MQQKLLALTVATLFFFVGSAYAVSIQTVKSEGGLTALLVEDYTVPLVSISFGFVGGSVQDPEGKAGTGNLLTTMLDEGAGDYDSKTLLSELDELGIRYSFDIDRDYFSGSATILNKDFDEAVDLLRLMLTRPRFDPDPIERMRETALNGLQNRTKRPSTLAGKALRESLYSGHPYRRSVLGEIPTVESITRSDLVDYHRRVFARDNLAIGIVGAISASDASTLVDTLFGDLPPESDLRPVPPLSVTTGESRHIEVDVPQTLITLVLPGIKRDDPDFFAAWLVNHILGGGSFTSRLYDEVRSKRGLAYSVYSYLATYEHGGVIGGGSATSAERADQTQKIILEEFERMATSGPTQEELDSAKRYVIGTYAIQNLDTSGKIASVLVSIQQQGLGIDYIDRRASYINSVTLEDARRVSGRLFGGSPTLITVGK